MGNKAEIKDKSEVPPVPKKGDIIYLPSDEFVSHGIVQKVVRGISDGQLTPFVVIEDFPQSMFNWGHLGPLQQKLKEKFSPPET